MRPLSPANLVLVGVGLVGLWLILSYASQRNLTSGLPSQRGQGTLRTTRRSGSLLV